VSFNWEEYLFLARQYSTGSNEAAIRSAIRSAISRAYYAAYHAARRHRGAANAQATRDGSHAAVWRTLRESGNRDWRKAGNQGREILDFRLQADYEDNVSGLAHKMNGTLRMAEEIIRLLGS